MVVDDDNSEVSLASRELLELFCVVRFLVTMTVVNDPKEAV